MSLSLPSLECATGRERTVAYGRLADDRRGIIARMNKQDKAPPTELKPANAVWEVARFLGICLLGFAAVSVLIGIGLIVVMGLSITAM